MRAAYILQHLEDRIPGDAIALQRVSKPPLGSGQTHQQVLGGDVGVLHFVGFGLRGFERLPSFPSEAHLAGAADRGETTQALFQLRPQGGVIGADALEQRHRQTALLVQEGRGDVLGLHLSVSTFLGEALRGRQCFLALECESFYLHYSVVVVVVVGGLVVVVDEVVVVDDVVVDCGMVVVVVASDVEVGDDPYWLTK